jgi:spore germination protein GerM
MSGKDDRKMKELADRLVAMSPEPPPFPEEVLVTQREDSKPRPVLVFAGAALVVLLLAAIPLWLARGGGEVDPIASSTTSTVASTVTTLPEATTTTGAAPTTSAPPMTTTQPAPTTTIPSEGVDGVFIFLTQSPENSFTGNPALVPFITNVVAGPGDHPVAVALSTLFNPGLAPPPGFESHVRPGIVVQSIDDETEGLRVVDLSAEFIEGSGSGALGDFTMLNQMIFTATDDEMTTEVLFTVDGQPVTQFGREGLDISSPLSRESFLDQVNSVNLETVVTGIGEFPQVIEGIANVFEATVSLELVAPDGNVVYEDFTTATCGTGCWGDFSFFVEDFDFAANPVTVRVFWHSAEDGSPTDVVSVPSSWGEDGPWDFVP